MGEQHRQGAWQEYDRWNAVIANVLFPESDVVVPVYLDMEEELLELLGAAIGIEPDDVESELSRVVASTLDLESVGTVFRQHSRRLVQWNKNRGTVLPVLALLGVLSLAAEKMARGDGLGPNNFYGRLRQLLDLPADDQKVTHAYQRIAERYWAALNSWLEHHDGRRGLPTAYSMSHRYVGLPISQALVRRADRERLVAFFERFGFAPGTEIPPAELEPVLDVWMSQEPCPATRNLERLWSKGQVRSRIAQTASVALAAWDGRIAERGADGGHRAGRVALALELSGFPRKRFRLSVLVFAAFPERERDALILSQAGDSRVTLSPAIPGALSLGQSVEIDSTSLLEGLFRIEDTLTSERLNRRPRRLVVFRQDQLSMRWIETDQVLLGDDVVVVAHSDLEDRLGRVLGAIARPGFSLVSDGYDGLPTDWLVYTGVEVFSHPGDLVPQRMDDLGALLPLTSSQLKVAGGFSLPGATRSKWHSWWPPEIRAVSNSPGGFEVRLYDLNRGLDDERDLEREVEELLLEVWSDEGHGALVADLGGCELEDGDYRVDLLPNGGKEPLTTTRIRLRSGDTPDEVQWRVASAISHDLVDPLAVIGGGTGVGGVVVRGAITSCNSGSGLSTAEVAPTPWWETVRSEGDSRPAAGMRVALPDPSSCMYTGRHVEVIEQVVVDRLGKPLQQWSVGHCSGCGLVRRYSTSYYRNKRKKEKAGAPTVVERRDVSGLVQVRQRDERPWDMLLDGILHTGGGRWSTLERLAMHIEPSALFVDQVARALESVGCIEVRRDPATLAPFEWEVTPTALAATAEGWFLSGHWPNGLADRMTGAITDHGGGLLRAAQVDGPSSWYFDASEDMLLEHVAATDPGITLVAEPARDLGAALPVLSAVIAGLPRRSADVDGTIRWFDVRRARWVTSSDLAAPGAYRITRFSTLDVVRGVSDVEAGMMATSSVQLGKHAAALILGERPLVAYNRATEELSVPLGADLPGLYGRAAVLASGLLPTTTGALLTYRQIPADLAGHLVHLLGH